MSVEQNGLCVGCGKRPPREWSGRGRPPIYCEVCSPVDEYGHAKRSNPGWYYRNRERARLLNRPANLRYKAKQRAKRPGPPELCVWCRQRPPRKRLPGIAGPHPVLCSVCAAIHPITRQRLRRRELEALGLATICGCGRDYMHVPLEEAHFCPRPIRKLKVDSPV